MTNVTIEVNGIDPILGIPRGDCSRLWRKSEHTSADHALSLPVR